MQKVISYSLWGFNPKYTIGAIRNAELAEKIYPDWICYFYIDPIVPIQIISKLKLFSNVKVIQMNNLGDWRGMFWRFKFPENTDVMIVRDTDSRLSMREKYAVDEWLNSDKGFHIMRDHPSHNFPILGGMWGIKKDIIPRIHWWNELIDNFNQQDCYGTDYQFLAQEVYPIIINNHVMIHDEFFEGKQFPTKREGLEFIGKVYNEKEETIIEHEEVLRNYLNAKRS